MCGITGMLAIQPGATVDKRLLSAMSDVLTHRGPDGSGNWINTSTTIGLAHRRLSIIDLSPTAVQPMRSACERATITFNGEIYNHLILRRELQDLGYCFKTDHSDTEVILNGYLAWGIEELLDRLDGMFAFGLWDNREKALFIARDRVGIKPLFFHRGETHFSFASEIKSLLLVPGVNRRLNQKALGHYLSFMATPSPLTLYSGIYKLPAAHLLTIQPGQALSAHKYWSPLSSAIAQQKKNLELSNTELQKKIYRRVERAVSKRLMSDVPIGVFLSAGTDSTAIATLAAKGSSNPVHTFSIGFEDHPQYNETEVAARTAERLSTIHHEILVNQSDMLQFATEHSGNYDLPTADWSSIPIHFLAKKAHESGVPVILSGEGADELFLGYPLTLKYALADKYLWNPYRAATTAGLRKNLATIALRHNSQGRLLEKVSELLVRAHRYKELYWGNSNAFWEVQKHRIINHQAPDTPHTDDDICELFNTRACLADNSGDLVDDYAKELALMEGGCDIGPRASMIDLKYRLPELLLARLDSMTMEDSIEGRVPFLDPDLVELALSLPANQKAPGGVTKGLLKSALSEVLPTEIQNRPKTGFQVPMADWLREDFGKLAMERIRGAELSRSGLLNMKEVDHLYQAHVQSKKDCTVQLWNLYALTNWAETWKVGVG